MTMYRVGPAGIPASLKTNMDAVLNKKFGTSTTYAPATWPDNVNLLGPLPEKTATGAVASITDGADAVPIKSWGVNVDANLSGVSAVECTQAGKNFIPLLTWYTAGYQYTNAGVTFEVLSDGGIRITGKSTSANYSQFNIVSYTSAPTTQWQLYVPTATYAFSLKNITSYIRMVTSGSSNNGFPYSEVTYSAQTRTGTVTDASKPFNYIILRVYPTADNIDVTVYPQLEIGSTATAFEIYTAPTVSTVSLGRTIYGGSVDVVNGTGTSEYALITFDGTQAILAGNYGTGGYVQYACSTLDIDPDIDKPLYDLQPGIYIDASTGNYRINSLVSGGTKRIRFNDVRLGDTITSKDDWNAYLSQNPVTVAYPLATPETFTFPPITPTPETPLGASNFWADEGDSEVTYRADINMLIASLSGNRGLMMTRPQLEEVTEENKEESPEVTEK